MKKITLFLVCLVFAGVNVLWAQDLQVSGVVTDATDGSTLPGVSVVIKGTKISATTNANGRYTIVVPSDGRLEFSFSGMKTKEIAVEGRTLLDVEMSEEAVILDEVIMVAYGTAKRETFVGSAGVVTAKKIEQRTIANVTKAIEGTVAGVQTTTGSGQPGSGASIRVRGFGSLYSSNEPLYVVDGAPYDGSISAINPDDISSISILKDASAGALYGARGANGVVLITTKHGADRDGKAQVNIKASWGFASRALPRYDMMNTQDYIETMFTLYKNQAINKNGIDPSIAGATAIQNMLAGSQRLFGANEQYNPYDRSIINLIDPVTGKIDPEAQLKYYQNWYDEAKRENPLRQEYQINVSGGNVKNKYFLSFGYLNEEGLLQSTSFERISGRLNLDSQVKPWLKVGANANVAFNKTNNRTAEGETNVTNVWYVSDKMAPIYPVYVVDPVTGKNVLDESGKPTYDIGSNRASGATPGYNAVGQLNADKFYTSSDNLGLRAFAEVGLNEDKYGWAKGFTFKFDANVANQNARGTSYYDQRYGSAKSSGGQLEKRAPRVFSYTVSEILSYNHTFNEKHLIDVIAGHEYYALQTNTLTASKLKFPFPDIYELTPGAVLNGIDSNEDNYRIESYLARAKYSYSDKYNFEASIRTDGSSRFYADSRWGLFWSLGANWRMSEEDFLKDFSWLNNLSLRASYGVQGNDMLLRSNGAPEYYAWQAFYTIGTANASNNGSVVSSLESRGLKWEKNANFNIGLEARLFDRLNVTLEFFDRTTSDMLLDVPMATSLGWDSYRDNVGNVYNRGIEANIGLEVFKTENFSWTLNLLGTMLKNKITHLVTERPIISGSVIYKENSPIYSYYLPRSAGVDPATGKQLYWVWDNRDPVTDERTSEPYVSSDVSKATNSREVCGTPIPDFYGSIGSEFTIFKYVDVSFLTAYSIGGKVLPSLYNTFLDPQSPGDNLHNNAKRAWKQPGDITDIPRLEFSSGNIATQSSLISASYFSIRNITVGFTFPKQWVNKMKLNTVRIFGTIDNVATFAAINGFDPQASLTTASPSYTYTPSRTVSFGVNLSF